MTGGVAAFLEDAGEPGRLGAQHFSFLTGVRALFCGWCGEGSDKSEGLGAIPFDKLANVTARTWNAARAITSDSSLLTLPFEERQGVHGPGQALTRHREEPQRYFLDVAFDLQEILPERALFNIDAWIDPVTGLPRPTDSRTRVRPTAPRPTVGELGTEVVTKAAEFLIPIGQALRPLDVNQVRALGTHCDAPTTVRAIDFHYIRLERARRRVLESLQDGRPPPVEVTDQMVISCDELRRKSIDNEERYAAATAAVLAELPTSLARSVFEAVHKPHGEIWTDPRVQAARASIAARTAVTTVLDLIAHFCCNPAAFGEVEQHRLDVALGELPSNHQLPAQIGQLCAALANGSLAARIADLFDRIS